MAQITGLKERQEALSKIESKVKSLRPLNVFLAATNDTNEYTVSFANVKTPTKIKASIYCEDKKVINDLVLAYKKKIVDEIREIADKYAITLDAEDLQAMEELFVPGARKEKEEV